MATSARQIRLHSVTSFWVRINAVNYGFRDIQWRMSLTRCGRTSSEEGSPESSEACMDRQTS